MFRKNLPDYLSAGDSEVDPRGVWKPENGEAGELI
jgi:hypothetical protein